MGGAVIDTGCRASLEKLFVAGEDSGGVHGANGWGVMASAIPPSYRRLCGKSVGQYLSNGNRAIQETRRGMVDESIELLTLPLKRATGPSPFDVRRQVQELNWNKVGVARQEPDLTDGISQIEALADEVDSLRVTGSPFYNMMFNTALDLRSMIDASRMIAASARAREETRVLTFGRTSPSSATTTDFSTSSSVAAPTASLSWKRNPWSSNTNRLRTARNTGSHDHFSRAAKKTVKEVPWITWPSIFTAAPERNLIARTRRANRCAGGELDPHRRENAKIGMWAWLWQRISALAIVVLLALHVALDLQAVHPVPTAADGHIPCRSRPPRDSARL